MQIRFVGSPLETCKSGPQQVLLIVKDTKSGDTLLTDDFKVYVVDYGIGRIPRSVTTALSSTVLGLGSLTMFMLTLLGKVDTTLGFTSGATALVVIGFLITRFLSLYQLPGQVTRTP